MTKKNYSSRSLIGKRVRALRLERHWTQARLAALLGISQNYLSELERGLGSFSAEELLFILKHFNVQVDYFSARKGPIENQIQNALARAGAGHLLERGDLLPSEKLKRAADAVREALVSGDSPRQITAAAPVFVNHAGQINLNKLRGEFTALGLQNRLGWTLDNTLEAIKLESAKTFPREWRVRYNRASIIINYFLSPWRVSLKPAAAHWPVPCDILDKDISSEATLQQVSLEASEISKRWGIATRIKVDDFAQALKAARDEH
ncbi:MAG: helix-turn-helix transcriptional regulator [Elusimicrobiota bacterium]|nr:helix-turn-helix transcriptional regulator [Elusimicrobiota bacterium]